MEESKELSELHPLINIFGTVGPLLFGCCGSIYALSFITSIPTVPEFRTLALIGLGLFIFGALCIPIQERLTH